MLFTLLLSANAWAADSEDRARLPDYLLARPQEQWIYGEDIRRKLRICTQSYCEAGFHRGDWFISVIRRGEFFEVVAGFRGCTVPVVAQMTLAGVSSAGKDESLNNLISEVANHSAIVCNAPRPQVNAFRVDRMYPEEATTLGKSDS